jgi:hypothetical protein
LGDFDQAMTPSGDPTNSCLGPPHKLSSVWLGRSSSLAMTGHLAS